MIEDKALITKLLEVTINATREGRVTLKYVEGTNWHDRYCEEAVIITCENGARDIVNVTADSGCALIRDVMKHKWFN